MSVFTRVSYAELREFLRRYPLGEALGFQAAILLTGHYGPNWQDLKTLLELIQPHVGVRLYGLPDFEANQPGFDGDGRSGGDHAGKVETSLLWALHPECVDPTRLPSVDDAGPHFAMGANAREANRRTGERMVATTAPVTASWTFSWVGDGWQSSRPPRVIAALLAEY